MKHPDPVRAEPEHSVPRPHGAPAYYQGRPASLWIKVMRPRHQRKAIAPKTPEPNDIEQSHSLLCGLPAAVSGWRAGPFHHFPCRISVAVQHA